MTETARRPPALTGSNRPRLGLVLGQLDRAGSETQALRLGRGLRALDWDVRVFSFRGGSLQPAGDRRRADIRVARNGIEALPLFWNWLAEFRPQALYTFTFRANGWGRLLGRCRRVPVLVAGYRSVRPYWFDRFCLHWNQAVICNTHRARRLVMDRYRMAPGRVAVIPNGIDWRRYPATGPRIGPAPVIALTARLHPHKDHLTALKALALLAPRFPGLRLALAGDGPLRAHLRAASRRLKIAGRVRFLGEIDDVAELLPQAAMGWLTSRVEGLPNAVLEYMACGLPVVATAAGGVAEAVGHGRTGFLVETGDYRALAACSAKLLGDARLARKMGRAGRRVVESGFDPGAMAAATARVIGRLLAENGRPAGPS